MDFISLYYFVTVCKEKNISQAAEKLFISKQALSNTMKKIEGEMNAVFFERRNSGLELTVEGKRFYDHAQCMLKMWNQSVEDIDALRREQRKQLRVGFEYMSWHLWRQEDELSFEAENPGVYLMAEGDLSQMLYRKLEEKKLDLVISSKQLDRYGPYDVELIQRRPLCLLIPQDDALAQKSLLSPADLKGRKVFYQEDGVEFMKRFIAFMESVGAPCRPMYVPAGNFIAQLKMVKQAQGLLLADQALSHIAPSIINFVVRQLVCDEEPEIPGTSIYALHLPGMGKNAAAKRFIAFFRKRLEERCV